MPDSPQKRFYHRNREAEVARASAWQKANRARCAATARKRREAAATKARTAAQRRQRKYGISDEEFNRMLDAQHGLCAICCGEMTTTGAMKCCVDHDHETGTVRALLCGRCNLMLGNALDNPLVLQAAVYYLQSQSA